MTAQDFTTPERYARQALFAPIGEEGQDRIGRSRVALIGCGALGTVIASTLARAGVGFMRICDRDYIELNNLQRQVLFDETDIAADLPKAAAAVEKLRRVNSSIELEPVVADVNHRNIRTLIDDVDLILDGTDNFETRYLINDAAIASGTPWIYGAVIGASGLVMPVLPGETACLRCAFETAPPPELSPTCDTAGVIGPAVNIVASFQCVEALKLLAGRRDAVTRKLLSIDAWSGRITALAIPPVRGDTPCVCCGRGEFPYLAGEAGSVAAALCGRNAVQVNRPAGAGTPDLDALMAKLATVANTPPTRNRFMIRAEVGRYLVTVFPDGRAIIKGVDDIDEARTVYSKYIGN